MGEAVVKLTGGNVPDVRIATRIEVARFFNVSPPEVDKWISDGAPYLVRGKVGREWRFDLLEIARWRYAPEARSDIDVDKLDPKSQLDYWKAQREKKNFLREEGKMLDFKEVRHEFLRVAAATQQAILVVGTQIAQDLATEDDEHACKAILNKALREALRALSESKYAPEEE